MEFLLINHPLDCPICDQGGECELQDLAMGYGSDVSRYTERKRIIKDENIGPLISTDMTRCIHCTRCVRFTQEIAGFQELGTIGRGESTEIGTFIEQSVDHELSANIIDLCPVGALNNKPYRYRARAWEMTQQPLVSPHDSVGTNMYAHVLRGTVMRIVPRPNEAINETWIADRDRFSYQGIYSADRVEQPLLREGDNWRAVDWDTALTHVAEKLGAFKGQGHHLGVLAAPTATLEELHLVAKITRALGSANLDHRLRRLDYRDQANDPVFPWLGTDIAGLEQADALLFVGSDLRSEAPLLAHRVRKAAVRRAAKVSFINRQAHAYLFPVAQNLAVNGLGIAEHLAAVLSAAAHSSGRAVPAALAARVGQVEASAAHTNIAAQLAQGERKYVLLGALAQRDPNFAELRALAAALADLTGAQLGYIAEGGNAVGAALAGVLPHRAAGGQPVTVKGLNTAEMLAAGLKAYVLFGAIEPDQDIAAAGARAALEKADFVVALTPYATAKEYADVILPIGTFAETSGTYVNLEGRWQSVPGAAKPVGESRPGWKVLRVLGNLLNLPGFDYLSSEDVRDELKAQLGEVQPDNSYAVGALQGAAVGTARDVGIYATDAIVRRSSALQQTAAARQG
jgi:NADH-quinone oxidoreductase subunit G